MVSRAAAATVTAERIRVFSAAVLEAHGMPADDAATVADALAWADLRGITAQGVAKLPLIVERLREGGTRAAGEIAVVARSGALTVLDGDGVWGHVAGARAMREAIAGAQGGGVGIAVVRNTESGSAMGYYATLAVNAGLIGLAINDGVALMPPPAGTSKVLGNQAFALACPAGRHPPLLFDSALSAISWTQIEELRANGEAVPEGVALNASGVPTRDHAEALAGMLLPIGGHRGFGLALMWEVLTGVLSGGARFASQITPLADTSRPQGVAHFHLAIDPAVFMPREQFAERVDALLDQVHASPPAARPARVFVPGEQGFAVAAKREREGIPIPQERVVALERLGAEHGVTW